MSTVPDQVLGRRYTLLHRHAAGATAAVWAAHDTLLDRRVAVKILHDHLADDPTSDIADRFQAEARAAAAVTHSGLIAVYDTLAGPPPAIVMEWVDGPDLRSRLDAGALPPAVVIDLGAELADSLHALHEAGLVHRDIKPANILLTTNGQTKLGDFGIATSQAGDRTATGVVLGTAKYLSPEQVQGATIDRRTDIYALATVLYEALGGRPPFVRDGDLPTAVARLDAEPEDIRRLAPWVSPILGDTIMRGLRRNPNERWPTAAAFAIALRGATGDTAPSPRTDAATTATPVQPAQPAQPGKRTRVPRRTRRQQRLRHQRRRRWPRVAGLLVALAIGALAAQLIVGSHSTQPAESPAVAGIETFDPEGTGARGEHDDRVERAIDGDPTTFWPTERYDQRTLGRKSGVGVIVGLHATAALTELEIHTSSRGWIAEVVVVDDPTIDDSTTRTDFGPAHTIVLGNTGTAIADLRGTQGDTILIWWTDLGDGALPVRIEVNELVLL